MEIAGLTYVRDCLEESHRVLGDCLADGEFQQSLVVVANVIATAMRHGGKVMLAGNGGSAADAQHIAGEFLSRLNYDRAPLAAVALTTDTSVLTAVGNDYGYERIFERQVLGLGRPGDVFVGISTSGRSPNILRALEAARQGGLIAVGFTGEAPGRMEACCDHLVRAPSASTPMIQQIHIIAAHVICGLVEATMFPQSEREVA
jgi:D-sedoheptulose 7-phosphate isomerase